MKKLIFTTSALILIGVAMPASAGPLHPIWDRVEDRIDRAENRRDERVDHGPLDVLEDRIDRREDRRDRAGLPTPRFTHRWERHSWKKHWGN